MKIAAQLAVEPTEVLKRVEARRLDRCEQVAIVAAREAWAHAGLAGDEPVVDPLRLAVIVGTGIGGAHDAARPGRPPGEPRGCARSPR